MFRLLRFFSLSSLVVVVVAASVINLYSHYTLRQTLMAHGRAENHAWAQSVKDSLMAVLHASEAAGAGSEALRRRLERALEGTSIHAFMLQDPEGKRLVAGPEDLRVELPSSASKPQLLRLESASGTRWMVTSTVPLLDGSGRLLGRLQVSDEVTELYNAVLGNYWRIGGFGISVLLLLYILLLAVVRYAERQLRAQHGRLEKSLKETQEARQDLERRVNARTRVLADEVAERRTVERNLREHEAYLQATMENVFNAIICIDVRGTIRFFNPTAEQMFGFQAAEVLGRNVKMLMPRHYADQHDAYLERYLHYGKAHIIGAPRELSGQRKDGSIIPLELAITETEQKNQTLFIGTIRDLTQQKEAERELSEARQKFHHQEKMAAIGSLAAGLVHEVGNPAAAISGLLDSLDNRELEACTGLQDSIALVREQVHRILQITRDMSEFSNPQGQNAQLLDLNNLIGRTCRLMRHDRRFRRVQLVLNLDNQIPAVHSVADYLVQVLMNLLINAVDAVEGLPTPRRYIRVASGQAAGGVWFAVEDKGKGMSAEELAHAREAFYTTKPVGRGTGLGLSLCDSLVASLGGELSIQSGLGQGTRVRVHLSAETQGVLPLRLQ